MQLCMYDIWILLVFSGAFIPGVAVQPVCVKYLNKHVSFMLLLHVAVKLPFVLVAGRRE